MNDMKHHPDARYGGMSQALHWVTAILVVYAFTNGLGGSEARVYASSRDTQRQLHETLGMCVLALVAIRLPWRRFEMRPDPPQTAQWMTAARTVVEWTLYVLLFAVPLTAIAGAWLEGHPLTMLAGRKIPPLIMASHVAGVTLSNLHTWLGDAIIWVGVFHALAALYHHFILKDAALISMLPRWLYRNSRGVKSAR
jgi:cytochrome b561